MKDVPESDWKYLRSIKQEMTEELSHRIMDDIRHTLGCEKISEDEKRHKVYKIVADGDRIVADCFDDWRRSAIIERCWALRRHRLLTEERLDRLAPETKQRILIFETK